jgi:alpha-L-arabinofuranosidase
MSPLRTLIGIATATILTAAGAGPGPATAAYEISIDPTATGPAIADTMYGVFFEDINDAADGGLYAELVRNRSFEFLPVDNPSYNGLTAWTPTAESGGAGAATPVDDGARLNDRNRTYLELALNNPPGGRFGVTNAGYNNGFALKRGARYDFSVWARTDSPTGTAVTVGVTGAERVRLTVRGNAWKRYTATIRATSTTDAGRLSVLAGGAGTLRLDMVSLMPRDTFKGHGLRRDLAEKVAALHPGFLRFPGGCLVNTGSMYGSARARSYQWKDTVGPVETRPTNANFWGYNQSYGLGYYEYLQFAEDIGAMPLPVVPALVTGCGQNRATDDEALLRRYIQDTLDLIEFANGPVRSTWGGLRARMGHPRPFGLTHIAVGNEENLPDAYFANFLRFRAAINAAYPGITVVSNSGPDDQGATFDQLWAMNKAAGTAMVDEHYYNSPAWFLGNNRRYDGYDRAGPKVFLGEYASLDDKLANSLAEAAYMTGLERNADIVRMASYAPLFANVDNVQWTPDMIWFDNDESWGSTSYQVQKLFMNNVGDRVVPSRSTGPVVGPKPITGAIGLSTWATAAAYDDVRVTSPDGTALFSDDFTDGAGQWTPVENRGSWAVTDGAYRQSDTVALDTLVKAGNITATDYDLELKATKLAGAEGFLVAFGVQESGELYWWNLGGWNNTQGAIQKGAGGAKEIVLAKPNTIETGKTYDIRISVRGTAVTLYLDGAEWGSFVDDQVTEPFAQVVTRDDATGDLIVKVVNAQDTPAVTTVRLGRRAVAGRARMTVITGDPQAVNTRTDQPIRPVTSTVAGIAPTFTRTFAANSVTFLRIRTR